MNLCIVHGVNNKFAYELFALLQHHLLHEFNCVAFNYNVARVLTQKLKLDYENIHVVPKGVSCFKGIIMMMSVVQNVEVFNIRMLNKVLFMKVLCHFPIIPKLQ